VSASRQVYRTMLPFELDALLYLIARAKNLSALFFGDVKSFLGKKRAGVQACMVCSRYALMCDIASLTEIEFTHDNYLGVVKDGSSVGAIRHQTNCCMGEVCVWCYTDGICTTPLC